MPCTTSGHGEVETAAPSTSAAAASSTPLSQLHELLVSLLLWWPYAPYQQCPSLLLCGPTSNGKSHLVRRVVRSANSIAVGVDDLTSHERTRRVLQVVPRLAASVAVQDAKDGTTGLRRLLRRSIQEACLTAQSQSELHSRRSTASGEKPPQQQLVVLLVLDHVECYLTQDDAYVNSAGDHYGGTSASAAATASGDDASSRLHAGLSTPYPALVADLYTILRSAPALFSEDECAALGLATVVYVSLFTGELDEVLPMVRHRFVDYALALPTPTEAERRCFFDGFVERSAHHSNNERQQQQREEQEGKLTTGGLPESLATALALRSGGVSYGGLQEIVSVALAQCAAQRTTTPSCKTGEEAPAVEAAAQQVLRAYLSSNSVTALEYRRSAGYVDVQSTRWEAIAGMAAVKETLRRLVADPVRHRDAYRRHHVRPSTGILLYGPPGTGKTMLAKAMATELNASFVYMDLPELVQSEVGESERRLQAYFEVARERSPSVVFMDEVQAAFGLRYGSERAGGHTALATTTSHDARLVSHLLRLLDAAQQDEEHFVLFVGATNVVHLLDPLLLRAGRLDTLLEVPLPDEVARESLVRRVVCGEWAEWFSPPSSTTRVAAPSGLSQRSGSASEPGSSRVQSALMREFVRLSDGFSGAQVRNLLSVFGLQLARRVSRELDTLSGSAIGELEEAEMSHPPHERAAMRKEVLRSAIEKFLTGSNGDGDVLNAEARRLIQLSFVKSKTE